LLAALAVRIVKRTLVLLAWLMSGVVWAQIPGPVELTGSGGDETTVVVPVLGSGGSITYEAPHVIHVFTINDDLSGPNDFVAPAGVTEIDVLVVGGGGAGGGDRRGGGGGGAGGVVWQEGYAFSGSAEIVIGDGGTGGVGNGGNGGQSSFNGALIAAGGGGGGRGDNGNDGNDGASGGGGGGAGGGGSAGGTGSQGGNGGAGTDGNNNADRGGGGGGAASGLPGNGGIGTAGAAGTGGAGGAGRDLSAELGVTYGEAGWFGGGGGGGTRTGTGGIGGQGGGGDSSAAPQAGTDGTGGGGAGISGDTNNSNGADGGSGIVIIRYVAPTESYRVHEFTTDDSFQAPAGVNAVDVLIVAGGGGGGGTYGGGGGAGGVRYEPNTAVTLTPIGVVVGVGGGGGVGIGFTEDVTGNGQQGGSSSFGALAAVGGGYGQGGAQDTVGTSGGDGGSGGGGGGIVSGNQNPGGAGTAGQGNNGGAGNASTTADNRSGGGGGGASATGLTGLNTAGGAGGDGENFVGTFGTGVGESGWFGGGGGGGKRSGGGLGGAGGAGGGGDGGGSADPVPVAGVANTGGGGGGSGGASGTAGAAGGSGAVVLRYQPATMELITDLNAPATVIAGEDFPQNIVVEILDSDGLPLAGIQVTAAKSFGAGTLNGTLVETTDGNGHAIFDDLNFTLQSGIHRVSFTAEGSDDAVETQDITVFAYRFEIDHVLTTGLCVSSTAVTISIFDSDDELVDDFDGTVTITNTANLGGYTVNTGTPANLTDADDDDGQATYEFDPADGGFVILDFTTTTADSYEFNAVSGSIVTENYDGPLEVTRVNSGYRMT
jgi:hypothetical protein